jgi:hypothetical protein
MSQNQELQVGTQVNFVSKNQTKQGNIVKIYDENGKTYAKIRSEKKYFYKQLKTLNNETN